MKVWSDQEWLRWGDDERNFIGFFSPIEIEGEADRGIVVKNKYGKYHVTITPTDDLYDFEVVTIEGIDYYAMAELAKYGMGYKWWTKEE